MKRTILVKSKGSPKGIVYCLNITKQQKAKLNEKFQFNFNNASTGKVLLQYALNYLNIPDGLLTSEDIAEIDKQTDIDYAQIMS
jgi:hypothetical protein